MLAWSEGSDNARQKTRNQAVTRHCRRRAIYWLLRSPRKLVTLNPKLKSTGAGRAQLLSVVDVYRKQLGLKDFFRKVRTLWHCSRLRSVALTYDWSWWYPSGNRPLQQYLGFTAGRWLCIARACWADSLIAKFKEAAERSERIDVWAESPRHLLWLSASSSACHGLLIITVITPLPTKPSATKMPENWSWRTRQITDMQMRQRDVAALDAKYTKELADAKAENGCLRRMMLPLVVVGCTS